MQERLLKTMLVCSILFSAVSMSVMLYFSATKTIVITEEALPEQSADRGKIPSGRQNRLQLLRLFRQLIFHPNGDFQILGSADQAVVFHLVEGFGEHGVGDAPDIAEQIVVTAGPIGRQ